MYPSLCPPASPPPVRAAPPPGVRRWGLSWGPCCTSPTCWGSVGPGRWGWCYQEVEEPGGWLCYWSCASSYHYPGVSTVSWRATDRDTQITCSSSPVKMPSGIRPSTLMCSTTMAEQTRLETVHCLTTSIYWRQFLNISSIIFHLSDDPPPNYLPQASVKNFQICHNSDPELIIMQLGRVEHNIFNMDFRQLSLHILSLPI